jgi:hypothetical protein|tara:strand:- start:21 stop:590 length:570 start_codon:yes stop_codon:yes gene_type:complete
MFFKREGLIRVGRVPNKFNFLSEISDWEWTQNEQRQKTFSQHRDTESIILRFKPPWILDLERCNSYKGEPYRLQSYQSIQKYIKHISNYLNFFSKIYNISDYGCMIVKLKPGGRIPPHVDCGNYFTNCSRIHIPMKSSKEVDFHLGDSKINMKVGKYYQINNTNFEHSVFNRGSSDRIHIIFDLFELSK